MATSTDAEIRARVGDSTIPKLFLETVAKHGDRVALKERRGEDDWVTRTFDQLADEAARIAAGLRAMGVGHGDRVVIMMRNIPEFHAVDVACTFLGATPVSIYNSSSPEQVAYLAGHCAAKVAVVEDAGFLDRFIQKRSELPHLTGIAILRDPDGSAGADVVQWDELAGHPPLDLQAEASNAKSDDLATIIYTSGTTGDPKGVMLSHFNVVWAGESLKESLRFDDPVGIRVISYLPMAHIAERMVSHYAGLYLAYEVTTCPEPGQIATYAREVKPNLMFGVPRVWEKVHAGVTAALAADPEKARQVSEAVEAALVIDEAKRSGTATPEQIETYDFLDAVAFSTIRQLIGLDELKIAVTGAAPISPELLLWYRAIGVPLTEVYGMSENTGGMTMSAWEPKPGTVGPALPGVEVKIDDDGEVCCRGGLVFQGYLNDPDKTADTIDSEGWLHSGDIGELDEDGYLRIVDRKKELIITAGGKNISPANLEASLKTISLVGQAAAVGDNRPFVAALVVLDPDVAGAWAAAHGLGDLSLVELAEHPDVIAAVEAELPEVMARFNNAERVKKLRILGEEWLPDSDLLTPTSKLKRRGIRERYAAEIEALYA